MADPKVLIVEDDRAIRALVVAALRRERLEVHAAEDGMTALDRLGQHDYAVILLDLMMPRLNGFEFLERLETERPNARPLIIVMSAFESAALRRIPPDRVHAVLNKPFDIEQVVEMVRDCARVAAGQSEADSASERRAGEIVG